MEVIQLALPLFAAPSFEEVSSRAGHGDLTVRLNRRLRNSWRVIVSPRRGERTLVVPAACADAPESIKQALIAWATMPKPRRGAHSVRIQKQLLETTIKKYLVETGIATQRNGRLDASQSGYHARGCRYDLVEIFQSLNERFFEGRINASIRWGSDGSTTSYQTNRRDRQGQRFALITIAGAYDHPEVPRFAIEGIVYHEMLHIAIPPYTRNGRRTIHGPEFTRAERSTPFFVLWREWERVHLRRCSRSIHTSIKVTSKLKRRNPFQLFNRGGFA
jgi:hypothetical protein